MTTPTAVCAETNWTLSGGGLRFCHIHEVRIGAGLRCRYQYHNGDCSSCGRRDGERDVWLVHGETITRETIVAPGGMCTVCLAVLLYEQGRLEAGIELLGVGATNPTAPRPRRLWQEIPCTRRGHTWGWPVGGIQTCQDCEASKLAEPSGRRCVLRSERW